MTYSTGTAPKARFFKLKMGDTKIGIGFADFSASVPRFSYFGEILHPGLRVYLFRVWNFGIQIVTTARRAR